MENIKLSQSFDDKKVKFEVEISEEYQLQCSIIYDNKEKASCQYKNKDEYPPLITFQKNEIICFEQLPEAIDFVKEWIEFPENYKLYDIEYQSKSFQIISEVLFALLVLPFKEIVEKNYMQYAKRINNL